MERSRRKHPRLAASSAKSTCNARPDHTLGHVQTSRAQKAQRVHDPDRVFTAKRSARNSLRAECA